MIFEVFTQVEDENGALYKMCHIEIDLGIRLKQNIKDILPSGVVNTLKSVKKRIKN
jgi:hypothetical protein